MDMRLEFNDFLRVMSCIIVILLIIQGLDFIFGFGVNKYMFILLCIVFAFTMGAIYHNILEIRLEEKKNNASTGTDNDDDVVVEEDVDTVGTVAIGSDGVDKESIGRMLDSEQESINEEYKLDGLTDDVLDRQIELNTRRHELDIKDESEVVNDEGFVQ